MRSAWTSASALQKLATYVIDTRTHYLLSSGTLCSAPAVWGNRHCHQDPDGNKPTNSHAAKDHRGEVPSFLLFTSYIDLDLQAAYVRVGASIL